MKTKNKDEVIRLRVTSEFKQAVEQAAAGEGLTVSAYITYILNKAIKKGE